MGTHQLHKHTQKGLACNTLLILMSLCATGVVSHHMRHGTVPLHLKLQTFQNGPTVSRCASYLIASHISVPFTCTISYKNFKTGLQVDERTLSLRISVPFTCTISHGHFKTGLQADVQATLSLRISVPFTCTTPPPPHPTHSSVFPPQLLRQARSTL